MMDRAFLALAVTRLGLPSLLRKFAGEHPSNLAALLLFLHLALEATRVQRFPSDWQQSPDRSQAIGTDPQMEGLGLSI